MKRKRILCYPILGSQEFKFLFFKRRTCKTNPNIFLTIEKHIGDKLKVRLKNIEYNQKIENKDNVKYFKARKNTQEFLRLFYRYTTFKVNWISYKFNREDKAKY